MVVDFYNLASALIYYPLKLLILALFCLIKIIATIFLGFLILAHYEAHIILNKKSPKNTTCTNNTCIYPPILSEIGYNTKLSYLLYHKYNLLTFDIMYLRVSTGSLYFTKFIHPKLLLQIIIYYTLGINKIFIKIFQLLWKYLGGASFNELLFFIFAHPADSRLLVQVGGCWVANGFKKEFFSFLSGLKDLSGNPIILNKAAYTKIINIACTLQHKHLAYFKLGLFNNKKDFKISHKFFDGISKIPGTWGLETSFASAQINNNYGKEVLINSYNGDKKLSTLLVQEGAFIEFKTDDFLIQTLTPKLLGAVLGGYNQELVTDSFAENVYTFELAKNELASLIVEGGWATDPDELLIKLSAWPVADLNLLADTLFN